MPHPNTHLLVLEEAVKSAKIKFLEKDQNYAWLGTFGPDLFYLLGRFNVLGFSRPYSADYGRKVSDTLHWEHSLDFFCSMLDQIKEEKNDDKKEKLKAFAYGYYSHVVTDTVMHPFVYMSTRDNWEKHPKHTYDEHKKLEAIIDTYLLKTRRGKNPYEYRFEKKIVCHRDNTKRTLDSDVYHFIAKSMNNVYSGIIPDFEKYFVNSGQSAGKLKDKIILYFVKHILHSESTQRNPILDAYRDTITAFRTLFSLSRKLPDGWFVLEPVKKLTESQETTMKQKVVCGRSGESELSYTVDELFDLSVTATARVIQESKKFLSSDSTSSREFFKKNSNNIIFLDHNYNLDTGLPSDNNSVLRIDDVTKIFDYSIPILEESYKRIKPA